MVYEQLEHVHIRVYCIKSRLEGSTWSCSFAFSALRSPYMIHLAGTNAAITFSSFGWSARKSTLHPNVIARIHPPARRIMQAHLLNYSYIYAMIHFIPADTGVKMEL